MIKISDSWKTLYPSAAVGILVMRKAKNPTRHGELDELGEKVESLLRERFFAGGKEALRADPVMTAYEGYYRRFRKTYHVALQLESVIWKGRSIPSVSALVKAMFMAELSNMLLTAGHDLAKVSLPIRIDVGREEEAYTALDGEQRAVKEGDMLISDTLGVISSILGGPDRRTSISAGTTDVLFTVYAPPGIGAQRVQAHLADVKRYVEVVAPEAVTESMETCLAE